MLHISVGRRDFWRIAVVIGGLALLFSLILPTPALAQMGPEGDACASCHWSEASHWQPSPHAVNGVSCEDCHGSYVEEHPASEMMLLSVDVARCQDCHPVTHAEWQQSLHAQANVNCINCHVSHAQTTRLASERLCVSCHANSFDQQYEATAHSAAGVTCVECHVSRPVGAVVDHAAHDFTAVSPQLCLSCHGQSLHDPVAASGGMSVSAAQTASLREDVHVLTGQLDEVKTQKASLEALAIIVLGAGLGVGLMIGLIFMLLLGYLNRRREEIS